MISREACNPHDDSYNNNPSIIECNGVSRHACPLQARILLSEIWPPETDVENQAQEKLVCTDVLVKILVSTARVSRATNRFYQFDQYRQIQWIYPWWAVGISMLYLSLFCLTLLFEDAISEQLRQFLISLPRPPCLLSTYNLTDPNSHHLLRQIA